MRTENELQDIATSLGLDTRKLIEPMKLALALVDDGASVADAAEICGVGRTALHRRINREKEKCPG